MNLGIRTAYSRIVSVTIGFFYQKWSNSWKINTDETEILNRLVENDEQAILVFWHGKFLPIFALLEGQNMLVFASGSFRGKILSHLSSIFGHKPSLLPTTEKGDAFRQMLRVAKTEKLVGFAIDGPLGPQHAVKPGAIKIASMLGHSIVPVSVASHRKKIMRRRWDKREWPFWGTGVALSVGDPIYIPAGIKGAALNEWIVKVTQAIHEADKHAEELCENMDKR